MYFRKPHVERTPQRILIHPKYNDSTLEFDIALVKIKAVKFSSHIQPVALPSTRQQDGSRKRRKLGKISRKVTIKKSESEQRLAKEKKRKTERKRKKLSESRIYQKQKRMNERLKYLKQKRKVMQENLNQISLQSGVKTSGKQRRRRTKKRNQRTPSLNELDKAMNKLNKAMDNVKDQIKQLEKQQKKGNGRKGVDEYHKNNKITWYS